MRLQMSLGETISESLWSSRFSIVTGSHLWHQIDRPVRKRAAYARFRRWRLNPPTTTFTLRNEPRTLVFDGGDLFQHHHHLHPQKRAAYARFRGWRPFSNTTTTSTFETEPRMLVFDGGDLWPTPPPPLPSVSWFYLPPLPCTPPSNASISACIRGEYFF